MAFYCSFNYFSKFNYFLPLNLDNYSKQYAVFPLYASGDSWQSGASCFGPSVSPSDHPLIVLNPAYVECLEGILKIWHKHSLWLEEKLIRLQLSKVKVHATSHSGLTSVSSFWALHPGRTWREFNHVWCKLSLRLKRTDLIVRGHRDLTKHGLAQNSNIYTRIMTKVPANIRK